MRAAARHTVDELWLATLERVVGRAAHEVKGALNGVSVNIEVVRLRAARPDAPASAVATFAATAGSQLEALTAMAEALLALGRPARTPVELATVLRHLGALLVPAAKADGVTLEVPVRLEQAYVVEVPGAVARLVLGAALLACIDERRDAAVVVTPGARAVDAIEVSVRPADGRALELPEEIAAIAADAGVGIGGGDTGLTLAFPSAETRVHERA